MMGSDLISKNLNKAISTPPFDCECIQCGYKILKSEKHCSELSCPKCDGQMRRTSRPGVGQG